MKAKIVQNYPAGRYDIWFFTDQHIWLPNGEYRPYDQGTQPEPSFSLNGEMLEALLKEAEKVIPASHATERHLNDALTVRDRLLTLVEEGWHD